MRASRVFAIAAITGIVLTGAAFALIDMDEPLENGTYRLPRAAIDGGCGDGLEAVFCEVGPTPVGLRVVPVVAEPVCSDEILTNGSFRLRMGLLKPRSTSIVFDCNNNGIPDECDIGECPPMDPSCQDCNGNGIPDGCEIDDCPPPGGPAPHGTGGVVFLSGDDADDNGHCQGTACGGLYPAVLSFAVTNSSSPGTGIVAVGVNGDPALSSLNGWNDPVNGGPGAAITVLTNPGDIAAVNFADFAVLYIPSNDANTVGGITETQMEALNARQPDIVDFVNNVRGGLIALTEKGLPNAYGWLPLPIVTEDLGVAFTEVCPTPELTAQLAPDVTCANMSHCCYHTIFTGPPGFLGLTVLAVTNQDPLGEAILLGGINVTIGGTITLTPSFATNPLGTEHTLTATVLEDAPPFDPIPGADVTFDVIAGPNVGDTGMDITDVNGLATFTYTGDGGLGFDSIQASFDDGAEIVLSNIAIKAWIPNCAVDCNGNGILDECEPEYTDIALFVSQLLINNPNPVLICLFDRNNDGQLNGNDVRPFVEDLLMQ